MDYVGFDLNLIVAFDALMAERHVTRAAIRIGLTQPAMSAALARLRKATGDELFVRGPKGLARSGIFRHVWHPALFDFAVYLIVLSSLILLAAHGKL